VLTLFAHPRRSGNSGDGSGLHLRVADMSSKKVLVIDDKPSQLKVMRRLLEKFGYVAVIAESAEEAEHILGFLEDFSLIITDLKMPWVSGIDFCRKVKTLYPNLKVYALSGYIYDFDINELDDAGFDGIYQKPISKKLLLEILNAHMEKY
jgi:CheY-like chemotaxis protein